MTFSSIWRVLLNLVTC
uniref:Uncharacterized protein n=1 Tax=Arundo donax TaxID=35708 RepID=A0A0A8ZQF5_ARUDO